MDLETTSDIGPVATQPEGDTRRLATPVAAPADPAPVWGLTVGDADDAAERRADEHAQTALARLQRVAGRRAALRAAGMTAEPATPLARLRRWPSPSTSRPQVAAAGGVLDDDSSARIGARLGTGRALQGPVRQRMETAFETPLDGVRIHDDSESAHLAATVSAAAFTVGSDIFFGTGQFDPGSLDGDRVLGHEIAHVLDGPSGAVRRSMVHYKEGYDSSYREGYLQSFWTGLKELVQAQAISQDAADGLYAEAKGTEVAYAANWKSAFSGTEGKYADFDDGKDVGFGAGFDQGYGDALKKGYARDYSPIPSALKLQVLPENGGTCAYCGVQPNADVDHIRSLKWHWQVRGAVKDKWTRSAEVNDLTNLVGACAACNRSKGAKKLLTEWNPPGWKGKVWRFGPARLGNALPPDWTK